MPGSLMKGGSSSRYSRRMTWPGVVAVRSGTRVRMPGAKVGSCGNANKVLNDELGWAGAADSVSL